MRLAVGLVAALAVFGAHGLPSEDAVAASEVSLVQEGAAGTNVAQCWRLKSMVRSNGLRDGFEWAMASIKMYEAADCTGTPLTGTPFSSGDQLKDCKVLHVNQRLSSGCIDTASMDGASKNAFDGNVKTAWVAKRRDSGEYIGLKLAAAKEVKCVKVQQFDQAHGARLARLEKSQDCKDYARVGEFPDFPLSYTKEITLKWDDLSQAPSGVFQLRSRHNVHKCLGPEVPASEADDVKYGIPQQKFADGAKLQIQKCNQNTLVQYFYLDTKNVLRSVKDKNSVLTIPSAESQGDPLVPKTPTEGDAVKLKRCTAGCPALNSDLKVDPTGGGLLIQKTSGYMVVSPKANKLATGTDVVMTACGTKATGGKLADCAAKANAQFDFVPLFTVAKGKQAVNCAPYSHTHQDKLKPTAVKSAWEAQQICAADKTCAVYMYVAADAADAPADDRGKAWFCTALDVVYSGKKGYQLGFRATNLGIEEEENMTVKQEL